MFNAKIIVFTNIRKGKWVRSVERAKRTALHRGEYEFDLALLDMDLGAGMGGAEVGRRITAGHVLPVLFLSAYDGPEYVAWTEQIRSYGYVLKDSGKWVLLRSVETVPTRMQHPDRTAGSLTYGPQRFANTTAWPDECDAGTARAEDGTPARVGHFSCDIIAGLEPVGRLELQIVNTEAHAGEDLFLSEEQDLVRSIAAQIGRLIHARNAEAELRKRERYVATALDSIGDAVVTTDIAGNVTRLNPVAARLTGWSKAEALGKHISEILQLVNAHTREPVSDPVEQVLAEGVVVGLANDTGLVARDETERRIADSAPPIRLQDGEPLGVVMVFRDVTEEYRQQRSLTEREAQFRSLFENNHAVMPLIDPADGAIVEANPAACNYYGWSREELLRMQFAEINTLASEGVKAETERDRTTRCSFFAFRHRRADGSVRDLQVYSGSVEYQERELLYSLIFDVTEQKKAQKQVIDLLVEKALLFRELQHRVKNNISAVIGLLALQAESTANAETAASLLYAGRRLKSMALLYDTLYLAGELHGVSLREYVPRLTDEIVDAFPHGEDLELAIDIEDVALKPDTVSPLGIILNELVTNAMKYAYTDTSDGRLEITGRLQGDYLALSVADNGAGLPDSMDIGTGDGFGLQLVKQLMDQMKGTVSKKRDHGTRVVLRFPRSEL